MANEQRERRKAEQRQRRIETSREYDEWIRRVQDSRIALHLSDTALNLLYISLGNECWREQYA